MLEAKRIEPGALQLAHSEVHPRSLVMPNGTVLDTLCLDFTVTPMPGPGGEARALLLYVRTDQIHKLVEQTHRALQHSAPGSPTTSVRRVQ